MVPTAIRRWIDIIEHRRTDDLDGLLADDAVFYSPAVFTPQEGKAKTAAYLAAAAQLFAGTGFHYVEQWFTDRSAVLEFAAEVDGIYVNGVDIIHWNDHDKIVEFKVMMRPLKALEKIMPEMARLLAP
jgi:SnoaL-like domain